MRRQLADNILPRAAVVHKADKGRAQLHVGDILGHIAADAAVHLLDTARVAPARDIGGQRIPLDVHKNSADDYDSHINSFPMCNFTADAVVLC